MKPFSLEEYLKNPSRKIVTRNGRNVRIICTDMKAQCYPIVALIQDNNRGLEYLASYTIDGIPAEYNEAYYTLFFAPEKHEGWVNFYKSPDEIAPCIGGLYNSEEEAKEKIGSNDLYLKTVKIEWEE